MNIPIIKEKWITYSIDDAPPWVFSYQMYTFQKESDGMASASSDKTSSTSNSKSTGGGYYTNDFKPSGKKDATPDKSSKSVSFTNIRRYMHSF